MDRINRLLEITERERNHELLLSMKNLREMGASPFPYIVSALPRLLPFELVKGEHFVLSDVLKLILGSSSQDDSALETFVWPDCLPLSGKIPNLPPRHQRKIRKRSGG